MIIRQVCLIASIQANRWILFEATDSAVYNSSKIKFENILILLSILSAQLEMHSINVLPGTEFWKNASDNTNSGAI